MSDNVLSRTSLSDKKPEQGGMGIELTFDMLKSQLLEMGQMKEDEVFTQVAVTPTSVILLTNREFVINIDQEDV